MKLNWGTGIAAAIIAFMIFILFMVFKASMTSTDLYAEDYYQQELDYETRITAKKNSMGVEEGVVLELKGDALSITFPPEVDPSIMEGSVHFYRPDDARFDQRFPLTKGTYEQKIPLEKLAPGNYQIKMSWTEGTKPFYTEKSFFIPVK